ncbi:PH domain-containing protein [Maribacter chungangensis]|uniref:PH domain-containing protein n=1 Tax=Maribacter chungangensis TaxID=1069117 RepID=A0ABW3B3X2_9FLAO
MKFKSRKDTLFTLIVFGVLSFVIVLIITGILKDEMAPEERWVMIPVSLVIGLVLWLYFGTCYELNQNEFIYWYGPFSGKVSIHKIREVVKGKTVYVGFRPATARNGLIIKYDTYGELYISPETNDSFIKRLLELKSDVIISE